MQTEPLLADYEISTDPDRLDVEVIHAFLAEDSYWSRGIPRSTPRSCRSGATTTASARSVVAIARGPATRRSYAARI